MFEDDEMEKRKERARLLRNSVGMITDSDNINIKYDNEFQEKMNKAKELRNSVGMITSNDLEEPEKQALDTNIDLPDITQDNNEPQIDYDATAKNYLNAASQAFDNIRKVPEIAYKIYEEQQQQKQQKKENEKKVYESLTDEQKKEIDKKIQESKSQNIPLPSETPSYEELKSKIEKEQQEKTSIKNTSFKLATPEQVKNLEKYSNTQYKAWEEAEKKNENIAKGGVDAFNEYVDTILDNIFGGLAKKPITGLANVATTITSLGIRGLESISKIFGFDEVSNNLNNAYNNVVDFGSDINEKANYESLVTSQIKDDFTRNSGKITDVISNMVGNQLVGYAVGIPGTVAQGLSVGGSSAQEVLDENKDNIGQATITGLTKGYTSYLTEKMFDANLLTRGESSSISRLVDNAISRNIQSKFGKEFANRLVGIVGENLEELVEDNVDNLIDKLVNNKDLPDFKQWWENTTETAKVTTLSTLIMSFLGLGGQTFENKEKDIQADKWIKEAQKIIEQEDMTIHYNPEQVKSKNSMDQFYVSQFNQNGELEKVTPTLGKEIKNINPQLMITPVIVKDSNSNLYEVIDGATGVVLDNSYYDSVVEAENSYNDKVRNLSEARISDINNTINEASYNIQNNVMSLVTQLEQQLPEIAEQYYQNNNSSSTDFSQDKNTDTFNNETANYTTENVQTEYGQNNDKKETIKRTFEKEIENHKNKSKTDNKVTGDLLEINSNIYDGISKKKQSSFMNEYLKNEVQGHDYYVDGEKIIATSRTIGKLKNGTTYFGNNIDNNIKSELKANIISNLDNIIQTSKIYQANRKDTKNHSFADAFDRRKSIFRYKGQNYEVMFDVGKKNGVNTLYGIENVKKTNKNRLSLPHLTSNNRGLNDTNKSVGSHKSKDSITQKNNSVKSNSQNANIQDFGEKIGGARKDLSMPRSTKPGKEVIHDYTVEKTDNGYTVNFKGKVLNDGFKTQVEAEQYILDFKNNIKNNRAFVKESNGMLMTSGNKYLVYLRNPRTLKSQYTGKSFANKQDAENYAMALSMYLKENGKNLFRPQIQKVDRVSANNKNTTKATGDDILNNFGFKGGEFGNWVKQSERQQFLNYAQDAFTDLAAALDITPDSLGQQGAMSIAFGARGQGLTGAVAHFEPGKKVINMTRLKGAGSLAHEYGHSIDNYLSREGGYDPNGMVTQNSRNPKLSDNMKNAIKDVEDAMRYNISTNQEEIDKKNAIYEKHRVENLEYNLGYIDKVFWGEAKNLRRIKGKYEDVPIKVTEKQKSDYKKIRNTLIDGKVTGDIDYKLNSQTLKTEKTYPEPINTLQKMYKEVVGRKLDDDTVYSLYRQGKQARQVTEVKSESTYSKSALELDKVTGRTSTYFSRIDEMWARAFESYISDKLKAKGIKDTYLVHSVNNNEYALFNPFPAGEERKNINKAFDKLIQTMKDEGLFTSSGTPQNFDEDTGIRYMKKNKVSKQSLAKQFENITGETIVRAEAKLAGIEMRNIQRQNGNLTGEFEKNPYSKEAMAIYNKYNNSKESSKYLYHSTPRENLQSIIENGLTIGNKQNQEGVSSKEKIYLSATEELAESFTPDDSVTLRINPNFELENLENDLLGGEGSYSITNNIPANMLQIKENGKWVSLNNISNKENIRLAKNNKEDNIIRNAERGESYIEQEIQKIEQTGNWDNSIPITKLTDIRKTIEDYLGLGIKKGHFRQDAYALYKGKNDVIRTKEYKDMDSILHETGHAMDIGNRLKIDKETIADELLTAIDKLGGYEGETRTVRLEEGFAEVIREYSIIPNQAKIDYPQTVAVLEGLRKTDTKFNNFITKVQQQAYNYIHQNPRNRTLSNISIGEQTDKQKITKNLIKQEVMRNIYDRDYVVKSAVNELAKATGKTTNQIKASENAYYLTRLASGKTDKVISMLSDGYIDEHGKKLMPGLNGIGDILGNDTQRWNDLRAYLVAQRDLEYKAKTLKTGIRTMDSKAVIEQFKNDKQIQQAAKLVYDTLDGVMQYAVNNGLISQESVEKIKQSNAFYVPMHRVLDNRGNQVGRRGAVADIIKKRTGSELDVKDVLENIIANSSNIIQQVENNNILRALYKEGQSTGLTGTIYDVIPTPMTKIGTAQLSTWENELKKQGVNTADLDLEKTIDLFAPNNKIDAQNLITSFINESGKRVYLQFNDELLFNSLMNMDKKFMSQVLKINSKMNMPLRYGATMANLGFAIPNMISDTAQATIYSTAGFIPVVDNVLGVLDILSAKNKTVRNFVNQVAPEYAKRINNLYALYQQSGATSSTRMSQYRENTQNLMADVYGTKSKTLGIKEKYKPLKRLLDILTYIPEISEQSTRFRVFEKNYEQYKKKGTAETDARILAALESRDATQDFGRTGNITREINQLIPFSAARVGSAYTFAEKIKANPKQVGMRIALLTTLAMAIKAMGYDDDEIEELNQRKKDDNFVFRAGDNIVTIKKPQGILRSIVNLTEYIQDLATGHIEEGKEGEKLAQWLNNAIMDNMPADEVTGFVPNAVAPIIENAINKDFYYNTDIVKSYDLDLPDSEQYYDYNSQLAIWLGKIFNYSPAKIDNLISGYFGGLGTTTTNTMDYVLGKAGIIPEKPEMGAEQNTIGKRFVVNVNTNSASIDEIYNRKTELTKKQNGGTITSDEEEELKTIKSAISNLSDLNKQIKEIKKDLTMSGEEKAEKIKVLQQEKTDTARQALGKELIHAENEAKIQSTQFYPNDTLKKNGYSLTLDSTQKKEYEQLANDFYTKYEKQGLYNKEKLEDIKSKAKEYAKNAMFKKYRTNIVKTK